MSSGVLSCESRQSGPSTSPPLVPPSMGGAGIAPLCRVRKPCSACPIEARSGHVTTNVGRPLGSSAHRPTPMHALPCVFPERSRRSRRLLRRVTRTRPVSCDAFAQKRPSKRTAPERGNRRRGDDLPAVQSARADTISVGDRLRRTPSHGPPPC